jgi:hypothetical protein
VYETLELMLRNLMHHLTEKEERSIGAVLLIRLRSSCLIKGIKSHGQKENANEDICVSELERK